LLLGEGLETPDSKFTTSHHQFNSDFKLISWTLSVHYNSPLIHSPLHSMNHNASFNAVGRLLAMHHRSSPIKFRHIEQKFVSNLGPFWYICLNGPRIQIFLIRHQWPILELIPHWGIYFHWHTVTLWTDNMSSQLSGGPNSVFCACPHNQNTSTTSNSDPLHKGRPHDPLCGPK
jgi:hypothetical protein